MPSPAEASTDSSSAPSPAPEAEQSAAESAPAPSGSAVSFEQLRDGWAAMLDGQSTAARARFLAGHIAAVNGTVIDFVLPTESQVKRCEPKLAEVEAAVAQTFGTPMKITLRAGDSPAPSASPQKTVVEVQDESEIDVNDLTDADVMNATVVDRIADVFPGAEVLDQES